MSGWTVWAYLIGKKAREGSLLLGEAQFFRHFVVKEAFPDAVGLNPFAIDHKLRDGALAGMFDDIVRRAGRALDVNFLERKIVFFQKALGLAAVGTPWSRVDGDFHCLISVTEVAVVGRWSLAVRRWSLAKSALTRFRRIGKGRGFGGRRAFSAAIKAWISAPGSRPRFCQRPTTNGQRRFLDTFRAFLRYTLRESSRPCRPAGWTF
jgi:hypothetical protein